MDRVDWIAVVTAGLVVAFRFYWTAWRMWNYPLCHGEGYFLGVAVEQGFYAGAGRRWLRTYRALVAGQFAILLAAVAVPLWTRQFRNLPLMAPIDVGSFFILIGGFALWARRVLGAKPPEETQVAARLAPRRIGEYLSWQLELLLLVVLGIGWAGAPGNWRDAVLMTYAVAGLLPAKVILARGSFPLPVERTAEHERWMESWRRYGLRVIEIMRWFLAVVFAGSRWETGWYWLRLGVAAGLALVLMAALIRGSGEITRLGRDLRPVGSWRGPFQPARMTLPGGMAWGVVYTVGLVGLLAFWR